MKCLTHVVSFRKLTQKEIDYSVYTNQPLQGTNAITMKRSKKIFEVYQLSNQPFTIIILNYYTIERE